METRSLETGQHQMETNSPSNAQQMPWSTEGSSVLIPLTFSMQECYSPFPSSLNQTSQLPIPRSSSGLGPGFSNLYGSGHFVPASGGDDSLAVADHFGFPGIPANSSLTPQPFLSFGDPGLTGFGGEICDLQTHSEPPHHAQPQSQSLHRGPSTFDQFWAQESFN